MADPLDGEYQSVFGRYVGQTETALLVSLGIFAGVLDFDFNVFDSFSGNIYDDSVEWHRPFVLGQNRQG